MSKDKEFVKRWLEALRSGEYSQTQSALRNAAGFCCLGVACDISGLDAWGEPIPEISGAHAYQSEYGFPSRDVMDCMGLSYTFLTDLAAMNDEGASFTEIADYIEASVESGSAYE